MRRPPPFTFLNKKPRQCDYVSPTGPVTIANCLLRAGHEGEHLAWGGGRDHWMPHDEWDPWENRGT